MATSEKSGKFGKPQCDVKNQKRDALGSHWAEVTFKEKCDLTETFFPLRHQSWSPKKQLIRKSRST